MCLINCTEPKQKNRVIADLKITILSIGFSYSIHCKCFHKLVNTITPSKYGSQVKLLRPIFTIVW